MLAACRAVHFLLLMVFVVAWLLRIHFIGKTHFYISALRLSYAEKFLETSMLSLGWRIFLLLLAFNTIIFTKENSLRPLLLFTLFSFGYHFPQAFQRDGIQLALGDLFCRFIIELWAEKVPILYTLEYRSKLVRLWIVQKYYFLLLGAIDSLKLESEKSLLKSFLVALRDQEFSLASYPTKETFYVHAGFVDEPVRFLKAYTFDRLKIVTSWQDASDKEHV